MIRAESAFGARGANVNTTAALDEARARAGGVPISRAPESLHADLVFVGRIIASEPALLMEGDLLIEVQKLIFEAADQPGVRIAALDDTGFCRDAGSDKEALLVFLRGNSRSVDRNANRPFFVYSCPHH